MVASVPKRFKDSDSQAEVLKVMPTFSDVQAQLSRHRQHQCTPIPDPLNIPEALRTTLRGREQHLQFEVQCRLIQLQAGRPPKSRRQCYIDNDARMWSAKQNYGTRLAQIFSYLFPHPRAWNELRVATEGYLDHCSHMLGLE